MAAKKYTEDEMEFLAVLEQELGQEQELQMLGDILDAGDVHHVVYQWDEAEARAEQEMYALRYARH